MSGDIDTGSMDMHICTRVSSSDGKLGGDAKDHDPGGGDADYSSAKRSNPQFHRPDRPRNGGSGSSSHHRFPPPLRAIAAPASKILSLGVDAK